MPGGRVKITSCATSSVLEIIRLEYEDEAIYTCYITNSMGSDSASMALNMHGESCDSHVIVHGHHTIGTYSSYICKFITPN